MVVPPLPPSSPLTTAALPEPHPMMTSSPRSLIDYYKAIEHTSTQMLDAARQDDWDEVVRLEGACAVLIEHLRAHSHASVLSADERAEKNRIMLAILRHDAQIRHLAEPWLEDLGQMMDRGVQPPSRLH